MTTPTRNLAILLTDIKGFTDKVSRKSRDELQKMLGLHRAIVLPILKGKGGRLIKTIGDAFLMTFESPTNAVQAGVAVQETLAAHNKDLPEDQRIEIRIAVNQGEVVLAENDVFGEPVNIAARLEAQTEAGEVFFTEAVYLSMNKAEVPCREVGLMQFKGVAEKVRIYKALLAQAAPVPPAKTAAPDPLPAPADPLVGRAVGGYRIESRLGPGRSGSVYRGRHLALGRPAAVKLVATPRLAGSATAWVSEARSCAHLVEPRIAAIREAGIDGDWAWAAMDLAEGRTLEDRVSRQGALAPEQARDLLEDLVAGLSTAHLQGLAHGDLEPRHVALQADGSALLLEFGLSPGPGRAAALDFAAPECAAGRPCDARADMYSVGALYFYALTGRPPYLAADPGQELQELCREAPAAAAGLVRRLMAKDPETRPTARALLRELVPPPPGQTPAEGPAKAAARPKPAPSRTLSPGLKALGLRLAATAAFLALFHRLWQRSCGPDWAAAGAFAAAAGALLIGSTSQRPRTRCWAALLCGVAMAAAFYRFGTGSFGLPAGSLSWQSWGFGALGLAAAAAALTLGLRPQVWPRLRAAQSLLCLGAGLLLLAACSAHLPPRAAWLHGIGRVMGAEGKAFLGSGGIWRWAPLFALWLTRKRLLP